MKRVFFAPALVLSLGLAAPICFAHGHGGGGGHMGGGHMGGGHMGGGHMGGGHHMGGMSMGHHMGGMSMGHHSGGMSMGHHHMGGSSFGGSNYYGGSHHMGGGSHYSSPGFNSSLHHHSSPTFSSGGQQFQHQGMSHQGIVNQGSLHHGGSINSGFQHHHQFQQQSGTALGSRPSLHQGAGSQFSNFGPQHQNGMSHHQNGGMNGTTHHHSAAMVGSGNAISSPGQQSHSHHFQNNLQQARHNWSQQPQGVNARHAALSNNLSGFHHGHHYGNGNNNGQNGQFSHHHGQGGNWNGNGHGNGNWNGNGHGHDWHNYHSRHYWPYYGWYTGFWSPGFGIGFGNAFGYGGFGYGGYGYGNYGYGSIYNSYPGWGAFGLTPWGINRQAWTFGYWNYSNPYCYSGVGGVGPYNYAQPLVTYQQQLPAVVPGGSMDSTNALPPGVTAEGKAAFDQALAAFRVGDSTAALNAINQAVEQMPSDAVAHEFRSLVLFSLGRYEESAEAIYAVLAVGPGWDWATMINLYGNPQDYTSQLRSLESYVGAHLDSSAARFLLAYHYMRCGHDENAIDQLKRVLELTPGNKVATDLLSVMEGPEAVKSVPGAAEPVLPEVPPLPDANAPQSETPNLTTPATPVPEMKSEQFEGNWQATGPDGTQFTLALNADMTFKWVFARDGKSQEVTGVWALKDGTLALEPNAGGDMIGNVKLDGDQKFNFRMVGAVSEDPGLNFARTSATK